VNNNQDFVGPAPEFETILLALAQPSAVTEFLVLLACLGLAWLLARLLRGRLRPERSVWFGDHIVDGVLFPVLALALAFAARLALHVMEIPLAVFRLAVPVLLSLALIRMAARVLTAAYPSRPWVGVAERFVSWMAWGVVVLWATGLLPRLLKEMEEIQWKVGNSQMSLRTLMEGVVTTLFVLVVVLWVSAAIERRLLRGTVEDLSLRKIAANSVRAVLLLLGVFFSLSAVGIDLTALSVLGGAVGVGLGFGLQKLAANYVSGFVILAERSLRIGDTVKVDTFEGRITDITTRYTVIRALNGRESIVPNEMLITQRVENLSLADTRVAASTTVQVAYGTDLDVLFPRLAAVVREVPRVLAEPGPGVALTDFGADGLMLTVGFWVDDPHSGTGGVRSDVNLAILRLFNLMGVEIPFPQRVWRGLPPGPLPVPGEGGPEAPGSDSAPTR
jgi:small-conductance mechanosensitive channel